MVFIPVIVPPTVLSSRSRELSVKLEETIQAYQRLHPEVSPTEVAQALAAIKTSRQATAPATRAVAVGLAALVAAGVGLFIALGSNGGQLPSTSGTPMVAIAIGVGVILLAVIIKLRRSSED